MHFENVEQSLCGYLGLLVTFLFVFQWHKHIVRCSIFVKLMTNCEDSIMYLGWANAVTQILHENSDQYFGLYIYSSIDLNILLKMCFSLPFLISIFWIVRHASDWKSAPACETHPDTNASSWTSNLWRSLCTPPPIIQSILLPCCPLIACSSFPLL